MNERTAGPYLGYTLTWQHAVLRWGKEDHQWVEVGTRSDPIESIDFRQGLARIHKASGEMYVMQGDPETSNGFIFRALPEIDYGAVTQR